MNWVEKEFEEKMTKYIDEIYKKIFKLLVSIHRSKRDSEDEKLLFMDIELAIDTHLTFKNRSILTFQEKTLRNCKRHWQQFTFEYYNDPATKEEGEWFKLSSLLYFFGYANKEETGYDEYWILNVAKLRTGLMRNYTLKYLEENFLKYNKPPAKASFFAIPFDILKKMDGVIMDHKLI